MAFCRLHSKNPPLWFQQVKNNHYNSQTITLPGIFVHLNANHEST